MPQSTNPRIRGVVRANRVPSLPLFKGSSNRQPEKSTHAQRVRSDHVLHTYEGIWATAPSLLTPHQTYNRRSPTIKPSR